MADDLIQSSMAGAQPVPANFSAEEADNLEDVSPVPCHALRLLSAPSLLLFYGLLI